jgi:hypothetical protein
MTIKIIEEESVTVTASEYAQYMDEWRKVCAFSVQPPTLEAFIKSKQRALNEGKQQLLNERNEW